MGYVLHPFGIPRLWGGKGINFPWASGAHGGVGDHSFGVSRARICLLRQQASRWQVDVRQNKTIEILRPNLRKCQASPAHGLGRPPEPSLSVVASRLVAELQRLCENGHLDNAVNILLHLEDLGIVPSVKVYRSLLKVCAARKALVHAKRVYAHLVSYGFESTSFLGEYMVGTLVTCGGYDDALKIFRRLPHKTVYSWSALISGFTASGHADEALSSYETMKEEGVHPNSYTFVSLAKACGSIADLKEGKRIHAEALKYGCVSNAIVRTCLIDMYGKCGSILDALNMFDELPQRDVVSWNVMLAAYVDQDQPEKALQMYGQMQKECVGSSNRTFVTALQACTMLAGKEQALVVEGRMIKVKALEKGNAILADAKMTGYDSDVFVGNTLVSLYGKCGSIVDAQNAFHALTQRNVVSWNAMLGAYVEQDQAHNGLQLYEKMQAEGVSPDAWTLVKTLQACGILGDKEEEVLGGQAWKTESLKKCKEVHAQAFKWGHSPNIFLGITLITTYGKCRSSADARAVFDGLPEVDVVAFTAMLTAYVENGQAEEALWIYRHMREGSESPNNRAFVGALQACSSLAGKEEHVMVDGFPTKVRSLQMGMHLHADAVQKGYDSDTFVGNTLIGMYGKCGRISEMQDVFGCLPCRNVVSWTALLTTYLEQGQGEEALVKYYEMNEECVIANDRTFVTMLQVVGFLAKKEDDLLVDGQLVKVKSLERGKAIHAQACIHLSDSDVFVGSALIGMYSKCGSILDARHLFDGLSARNTVSWNVMLAAYVKQGQLKEALQLYSIMQQERASLDEITIMWVLQACGTTGSLVMVRQVHQCVTFAEPYLSPFLSSSIIAAYGRCASMLDAQRVFDSLSDADVVLWNALSAGYARQGDLAGSLMCYNKMQLVGVTPNGVTFLSLISACSHAGLIEKGVNYFASMTLDHGIVPEINHYVSLVDLFGRAGFFQRIEELMATMPVQPDLAMWLCLLGSCQKHGNVVLGELAFNYAVHLQPHHGAAYALMANIYWDAGLSEQIEKLHMKDTGAACKKFGQSWIEHAQEVEIFLAGNLQQTQYHGVYELVRQTSSRLQKEGEVPRALFILQGETAEFSSLGRAQDLDQPRENGCRIPVYSNRSLAQPEPGGKSVGRLLSALSREIKVVRDRVHHFKDGECSCKQFGSSSTRIMTVKVEETL